MTPLQHLHPATIHFPIAFLSVGSALALFALWRAATPNLRFAIWLLLGLGWLGSAVAVLSGLFAQAGLPPGAPYAAVLNWHIASGVALTVLYGAVLYWGWTYRSPRRHKRRAAQGNPATDLLADSRARPWLTALLVLGILLIFLSGWNGGVLVYEFGVNVLN
jgi:uncharacterized membrane protein